MVPARHADPVGRRPLALSAPNWPHRGYRLLMGAVAPLALAWLWWRGRKDPGYRENMAQRLGRIEPTPSSVHGILIHAASVGEVQAAKPLIEALRNHWPAHTITVTTQTPTGKRALQSQWGEVLQHFYFPVDTPGATSRFLQRLQPSLVVLIEREVWPEWLRQCRARAIPVALVNARLSEKSRTSYQRSLALMGPAWRGLGLVAAADPASAQRLADLGVPKDRLITTGNLKFDQPLAAAHADLQPVSTWSRPTIVAGSTHEGEEAALLDAWPAFLTQNPAAVLVLVPRHPERFENVAQQIQARGFAFSRRSLRETPTEATSIWLGDSMGELGIWYAQASVCFIGGTLVPIGGHNPLEALAASKPVVFGPHTHNAAATYEAIEAGKVGARVSSAALALQTAGQWMADPASLSLLEQGARAFVKTHQGGSQATLEALKPLWAPLDPLQLNAVVEQQHKVSTVWHDASLMGNAPAHLYFDPPEHTTTTLATGSGRGQAQRLNVNGQDLVLRHYRRGGWVARFNPDRYRLTAARDSRAMREYSFLRWMRASGLPVPVAVAARQKVSGSSYTADIMVGMIPNTQNLVQRLVQAPLNEHQWRAVGRAIKNLHTAQVFHSDLNAHNILLDGNERVWIVDFDKCETREGGTWKRQNLDRLVRSLRKESGRLNPFHWTSSDIESLNAGYGP